MAVLLGLGLCKGREKLIVCTHKEFTLRHKAACKAKWESATSLCKLINHWFKRASEVRASVSSGNSHMHFWVRKIKFTGQEKQQKGTSRTNQMICPLPTRNFYFRRRTAQGLGFPFVFYPHGPARRDSLGLHHSMWHWFPKSVGKPAGWSSLLLTCPLLGWLETA